MIEWIIIGIIVLVALVFIYYFNRIIGSFNNIKNAWAQIDVQLKKRADLVPNLVETVKGYAKHEKDIMTEVTKARERMMKAGGNVKESAAANNALTGALKTIFALAENYPNLKANENFKLLQEQLDGIESKIAYSRQYYNDSVLQFNNIIQMFPGRFFAGMMGKGTLQEYFEVAEADKKLPKVKF